MSLEVPAQIPFVSLNSKELSDIEHKESFLYLQIMLSLFKAACCCCHQLTENDRQIQESVAVFKEWTMQIVRDLKAASMQELSCEILLSFLNLSPVLTKVSKCMFFYGLEKKRVASWNPLIAHIGSAQVQG